MKKFYDFSKGKRGALFPVPPGKTRITIRLDNEVLDWFRDQVEARGGGSYQAMINDALRDFINRGRASLKEEVKLALQEVLSAGRFNEITAILNNATATSYGVRDDIPLKPLSSAVSDRFILYGGIGNKELQGGRN